MVKQSTVVARAVGLKPALPKKVFYCERVCFVASLLAMTLANASFGNSYLVKGVNELIQFLPSGQIDFSFGMNGHLPLSGARQSFWNLGEDEKGRLYLGGYKDYGSGSKTAVTRLNPSGTIDVSFGDRGRWLAGVPTSGFFRLARDGGFFFFYGEGTLAFCWHFLNNLSRDQHFGKDGVLTLSFPEDIGVNRLFLTEPFEDDKGRLLMRIGGISDANQTVNYSLRRFFPDGHVDKSFGTEGELRSQFKFGEYSRATFHIASTADGKYVLGGHHGTTAQTPILLRLLDNGTTDESFGNHGVVDLANDPTISGMVMDIHPGKQGEVFALFSQDDRMAIARVTSEGHLDSAFGDSGIPEWEANNYPVYPKLFLGESSLVVSTFSRFQSDIAEWSGACLRKFDLAGRPDKAFGNNGLACAGTR